jgi:hypothetical protein
MAKAKKSAANNTSSDQAEARPIGEGKDPLAEGNTLVNPTNTEAETHYDIKEKSSDVSEAEEASRIKGQDANERAEQHNSALAQGAPNHETPNQGQADQEEAAADADREGR